MIVAIAGGNLQGIEAAYLAKKAGWHVIVMDKHPNPPASGLCDQFVHIYFEYMKNIPELVKKVDFILPALENSIALNCLSKFALVHGIPFAFSKKAYAISSSKISSNDLFARIGISTPLPWPACGFPVIGKPDSTSGSRGIEIFRNRPEITG